MPFQNTKVETDADALLNPCAVSSLSYTDNNLSVVDTSCPQHASTFQTCSKQTSIYSMQQENVSVQRVMHHKHGFLFMYTFTYSQVQATDV
jgi:hypothetical protein